ncbi:DUF429 domain-containing protein [Paracoccus sp. TK19116]|uniref:DUF429 domain-containing protein n=1 Tax=Paracoccus albicereus TaxID=2922394 RepID=A0ABT1MT07_9RHOB|nr:DUF429 domain-containing protein [Paracoccus albicereus]MCQ0971321.1 DUF429 domain-containing protein [Paracoccus albicereus]
MRVVLGIDAAWTLHHPSGVALAVEEGAWRLAGVWPSYAAFLNSDVLPTTALLIARCVELVGAPPDLVTVDMPLSLDPITGRRASDTGVSRAFAARGAATHSPTALRPGPVADRLRADFAAAGYPLLTKGQPGRLAEVYPHPALIHLMGADRRLPYKVARAAKYRPLLPPQPRKQRLVEQWRAILDRLDCVLPGSSTMLALPDPQDRLAALKAFEDQFDGIICAWVATEILDGRATAYGDDRSAIWVPEPPR